MIRCLPNTIDPRTEGFAISIVRHSKLIIVLLNLLLVVGCSASNSPPLPPEDPPGMPVYLINLGWHTGLAVRPADIPPRYWPEREDFPDVAYIEVGWGDYDFYQSRGFDLWLMLKAGLFPNPSVLHVVGLTEPPGRVFASAEVVRIDLSVHDFERLIAFIDDTFDRGDGQRAPVIGPGHYAISFFYPAEGRFHMLNNCNTWVAEALHAARVPVVPFFAVTAGSLMAQAREFAADAPAER
jgi:uncharacterized protein (TIGR02117 family)